jgi:hypothetical protein
LGKVILSVNVIDTEITGRASPNKYQANSSKLVAALAQFYRVHNSCDLVLMAKNWVRSDDIAMDNPLRGVKRE